MPPTVKEAPYPGPHERGESAAAWLAEQGWRHRELLVRSSDYGMLRECPFTWYIRRRLGLARASSYSPALARGSWAHLAFACKVAGRDESQYGAALEVRIDEIRAAAKVQGWGPETVADMTQRTERDSVQAWAWVDAAWTLPVNGEGLTMERWFGAHEVLSQEAMIQHGGRAAVPDAVVRDSAGGVWIVDFKTTSHDTVTRLQTCPAEFQTQHYFWTAEDAGMAPRGVVHWCVSKPGFRFGMNDRPFALDTSPLKSGPRKGRPRNEKVYVGDPSPAIHRHRVREWMEGTGEFMQHAGERALRPAVNMSCTGAEHLRADDMRRMYDSRLAFCRSYFDRPPWPSSFECGDVRAERSGQQPVALPFMLMPVSSWPEIIAHERLVQRDREDACETQEEDKEQ